MSISGRASGAAGQALKFPRRSDPADSAAAVLLRLGLFVLFVVTPAIGVFSRRGILIAAPAGIVLLLLSAALAGGFARAARGVGEALASPGGVAACLFFFWAFLSLLWSPVPGQSVERLARITLTGLIAALACHSLPERARATNLYLLPVGSAAAALLALGASFLGQLPSAAADSDQPTLERALAGASVCAFAGVAWLAARNRNMLAMALASILLAAAIFLQVTPAMLAIAAGAVVLGGSAYRPPETARALGWIAAALVLAAPLIALAAGGLSGSLSLSNPELAKPWTVWARTLWDEPLRSLTGRGLDTSFRHKLTGELDNAAPQGLLFMVWYELGLIGAASFAVALGMAARACGQLGLVVAPFALGAMAAAFVYAMLGVGVFQPWWLTALSIAAIGFACVRSGLYRTSRPEASLFPGRRPSGA